MTTALSLHMTTAQHKQNPAAYVEAGADALGSVLAEALCSTSTQQGAACHSMAQHAIPHLAVVNNGCCLVAVKPGQLDRPAQQLHHAG